MLIMKRISNDTINVYKFNDPKTFAITDELSNQQIHCMLLRKTWYIRVILERFVQKQDVKGKFMT